MHATGQNSCCNLHFLGLESTFTTTLMYFKYAYFPFKFIKGKQYLCLTVSAFQCSQQNWGFTLRSVTPREDNCDLCCYSVLLDAWWIFIRLIRGQRVEWEEGGTICLFLLDKNVSKDRTSGKPQTFIFWTNGSSQSRQAFRKKALAKSA